jgi:hypothetical protein
MRIGPKFLPCRCIPSLSNDAALTSARLFRAATAHFKRFHWIGLTAIHATQLVGARFLYERQPHCLVAHRTERRVGLGLSHDARLHRAGAQDSQSPCNCRDRVGDGKHHAPRVPRRTVKRAHSREFNESGQQPQNTDGDPPIFCCQPTSPA